MMTKAIAVHVVRLRPSSARLHQASYMKVEYICTKCVMMGQGGSYMYKMGVGGCYMYKMEVGGCCLRRTHGTAEN